LTGAGSAGDEGNPVVGRHAANAREHFQHLRAAAHDAFELTGFKEFDFEFHRAVALARFIQKRFHSPAPWRMASTADSVE
jgi:hypothetical protein